MICVELKVLLHKFIFYFNGEKINRIPGTLVRAHIFLPTHEIFWLTFQKMLNMNAATAHFYTSKENNDVCQYLHI